jgi:hypothetical protein
MSRDQVSSEILLKKILLLNTHCKESSIQEFQKFNMSNKVEECQRWCQTILNDVEALDNVKQSQDVRQSQESHKLLDEVRSVGQSRVKSEVLDN